MCIAYQRIFSTVKQSSNKVHKGQNGDNAKKTSSTKENKLLRTLIVTVIVFVLFWAPQFLLTPLSSVAKKIRLPPWMTTFGFYLALCNSSVNFIIYGVTNKQFRNGYKVLLRICLKPCMGRSRLTKVQEISVTGTTEQTKS